MTIQCRPPKMVPDEPPWWAITLACLVVALVAYMAVR